VVERKLAALAALDELRDGGLCGADVARSKGKASSRRAKKAARTAEKLARMPRARGKLAAGTITEEHADSLADAAERVEDPEAVDEALADTAELLPADLFHKKSRDWAGRNEPEDSAENGHRRRRANRRLAVFEGDDNMIVIAGQADPIVGAQMLAALDGEVDRLWHLDGGRDGDPLASRTPEQRRFDALANFILGRPGESTFGSKPGGHPKHQVLITIPVDRYLTGEGDAAEMIGVGPLPSSVLDQLLCDAEIAPLITDAMGRPLWLGRSHRAANAHQWRALMARDMGCVICGTSPSHCEAHHITRWQHHGNTDLTNLVLLCTHHHHQLHDHNLTLDNTQGIWTLQPRPKPRPRAAA